MATYVGPIEHLRGKTARVRTATHGKVVAQFDDISATRSGTAIENYQEVPLETNDALGFGWHVFNPSDFESEIQS